MPHLAEIVVVAVVLCGLGLALWLRARRRAALSPAQREAEDAQDKRDLRDW